MAEVGAGEAQADGGVRAESVARFHDDETAPGAHEGGSRAQQLLQRVVQCRGAHQALGEFVEVVRSDTQPASRSWRTAPGPVDEVAEEEPVAEPVTEVVGATVCAGAGTVESIPATFGT